MHSYSGGLLHNKKEQIQELGWISKSIMLSERTGSESYTTWVHLCVMYSKIQNYSDERTDSGGQELGLEECVMARGSRVQFWGDETVLFWLCWSLHKSHMCQNSQSCTSPQSQFYYMLIFKTNVILEWSLTR